MYVYTYTYIYTYIYEAIHRRRTSVERRSRRCQQAERRGRLVGGQTPRGGGPWCAPLGPYSRNMPRALWWSYGGGAVSYERGTPVEGAAGARRYLGFPRTCLCCPWCLGWNRACLCCQGGGLSRARCRSRTPMPRCCGAVRGFGFRVYGSGFRVCGLGFRFGILGLRGGNLGFGVRV